MNITPDAIIAEARSWIGTRFQHQGRLKKTSVHAGGVDCLGLLLGVADGLNITSYGKPIMAFDDRSYGRIPDGAALYLALKQHCSEVPLSDIQPGDIVLCRFDFNPQHVALVGDYPQGLSLIHAYADAKAVVEHRLDAHWMAKMVAGFRFNF